MDLSTDLHLVAGLGAFGLGIGVFLRDPGRTRNRLFALLCGCLCLWNLGVAGNRLPTRPDLPWRQIYLLGSCFSAPVGLHFATRFVGGVSTRIRYLLVPAGYLLAAGLWVSSWTSLHDSRTAWNLFALGILGPVLVAALVLLIRKSFSLPIGSERNAFRWLIAGAVFGFIGGMSDLVPRGNSGFPRLGPLFLMFFLLIVASPPG